MTALRAILDRDAQVPVLWNALSWLVLVVGAGFALSALAFVLVGRHPIMTDWLYFFQRGDGLSAWGAATALLEGHLQVLPRLVAELDLLVAELDLAVTGGRNLLLGTSGLAAHLAAAAVLVAVANGLAAPAGPAARRTLIGFVLVAVFFAPDIQSFVRGDSQHLWIPFATVFPVLALAALARALAASGRRAIPWYVASFAMATAATFSGIIGVIAWPALLFAIIVGRGGWRPLAWIAVPGVVFVYMFLRGGNEGLVGGSAYEVLVSLTDPLHLLAAQAAFFGTPMSLSMFVAPLSQFSFQAGVAVGLFGFALQAFLLVEGLVQRSADPWEAAGLGLLAYAAVWNLMYAVKHFPPGVEIWGYGRFWAIVMISWVVMILLLWRRLGGRALATRGVAVVTVAATVLFFPVRTFVALSAQADVGLVAAMGTAVAAEVRDDVLHARFTYHFAEIAVQNDFLRLRRARALHDTAPRAFGTALAVPADAPSCDGRVLDRATLPNGGGARRVWGTWSATDRSPGGIVGIDRTGKVVGVGRAWRPAWFAGIVPDLGPGSAADCWLAYVRAGAAAPVRYFVLEHDGRVRCRLRGGGD